MKRSARTELTPLLLLLVSLATLCASEKASVSTCGQLWGALGDASVSHIVAQRAGSFNCTPQDFPGSPLELAGRTLLLEGEGPGLLYVDFNRFSGMVLVSGGSSLTLRNLWLDDCLGPEMPAVCMANVLEDGWLTFADMRMSDAGCINAQRSRGIAEVDRLVRYTLGKQRYHRPLDDRTALVKDTGWLSGAAVESHWRLVNTTFTCTGNLTHPLPEDFVDLEFWHLSPALLASGAAVLLLLAGMLVWCARVRARNSHLPEHRIAAARGYKLEQPLGSGHFGRVYRGRHVRTGQLVAVKVIDLLPSQRKQVVAAYRECQLLSGLNHECIVRVATFYTHRLKRQHHILESTTHGEYVEVGYSLPPDANPAWTSGSSSASASAPPPSSGDTRPFHSGSSTASTNSWPVGPGSGSSSCGPLAHSGGSSGSGAPPSASMWGRRSGGDVQEKDGMEGVVAIQVQLVTQYCDMGTLEQAVRGGTFLDAATGQHRLHAMYLTALEVARGLRYLHAPERRMVHRDLSANNVLLTTAGGDERGFRALLSDFGLSTVLSAEQTHRTSQVKGTISYMSPELFVQDSVSPALDIYSLGVVMYLMWAGKDPYANKTTAMIILSKVKADSQLPALEGCPREYQQLVDDCTRYDRRSRPTAEQVVRRLEALLLPT